MPEGFEEKIRRERKEFYDEARTLISDMGDELSPEQRKNLVRSIVKDYNPLPPEVADEFIEEYRDWIEGKSE